MISKNIKIFFFVIIYLFFSLITLTVFLSEIAYFESGLQSHYIVDLYFYRFIGESYVLENPENFSWQNLLFYSPNPQSLGITLISILFAYIDVSVYLIPALLAVIYSFFFFYRNNSILLILILFSGLMPYLVLPSKEAIILLGVFSILYGVYPKRNFPWLMLGIFLIVLSRPQMILILGAAFCLFEIIKRKTFVKLLIISFIFLLYFSIREQIVSISILFQGVSNIDCFVGPLNICVNQENFFEFTVLQRALAVLLIPLKWGMDFFELFLFEFSSSSWIIRISQFSTLILLILTFFTFKKCNRNIRLFGLCLAFVYIFSYATVFYFQLSRQVLFGIVILFISFIIGMQDEKESSISNTKKT
tara:strand:+ start:7547 stop:8629 length:1083 start_codon:yes stop_codon:yes gene_type:complete